MGRTLTLGSNAARTMLALMAMIAILLVSACSEQPEAEGFRAVYSGTANGGDMTVFGDTEGNLNFTIDGEETRGLHVDGENYIIFSQDGKPLVLDAKLMGDLMAEAVPEQIKQMMDKAPLKKIQLRDDGETDVNGRKGTGYRMATNDKSGRYFVVISKDPELAPFAKAMSRQFTTSIALNPMARKGMFDDVVEVLETGFPIALGAGSLKEFEKRAVDPETFKLPAKPLDKEATREAMVERGMLPEQPVAVPQEMLDDFEKRLNEAEPAE